MDVMPVEAGTQSLHRSWAPTFAGVTACLFLAGCATVPYTNRRQFNIISDDQEQQMGLQAFADVKSKNKISQDAGTNAAVERVGRRIAAAAEKPDWKWQFVVIDDPKTVNAFCLPGGKIAVYTGILPLTRDDAGLAVVLGHEVSHALAHHGAERMSDQELVSLPMAALLEGKSEEAQQLIQGAFGIGLALPFSRKQESEADHIGLILMAKAGYHPREAAGFWARMSKLMEGKAPPAFLSDHPSDSQRINKIQEELPEALQYYRP
jgi:metalloendopeptidase OMA1, mitochondrial